jgi:beta-mannosidase
VGSVELTGTWRASVADEDLRRSFTSPDFDDAGWEPLAVPGHWRSSPAFADADGPLLYRRPFDAPPPVGGERAWLVLDGLFYQGDVWLDGAYAGDTEGYFFPHAFEVTDALRDRTEHVLAVEVACAPQRDRAAKRNITGVFQHWDALDPEWNPGGIWRTVRVTRTGPVRISSLRVLCAEANEERAVVSFRAVLDAAEGGPALVCTRVGGTDQERQQTLAAGENRIEWTVSVEQPDLWWPHALGAQALHDVCVDVWAGPPGREGPSDSRTLRIGLRQVRMKKWVLHVNGERLFVKGSNQGPTRMALAEATAGDCRRDVALAREAGLDLLRVHAHVARPELYEAADEAGLLLWQDMPLQWGYARGIRKQAVRQARAAVDLLGHHPSVALWCGHNEPLAIDVEPGVLEDPTARRRVALRAAVGMELPSWNKTVLDHSVKSALEKADRSRPVVAHSGVLPHPGSGGTDTHAYFGWYYGDERSLPRLLAAFPRLARFVSEFGAQAVPDSADFLEPHRWPDLDWERLTRRHSLQKAVFDRYVPPEAHDTFDSWRKATQDYQATVIRHHVEYLRRIKYRPTGGFCHFSFADAYPSVTWSVLDHERRPKAGYAALAEACRPVIVTADRPATAYRPGDAVALDVHVVNDLRRPLPGATVTARLAWDGGEAAWSWEGDVPADDCARVGMVRAIVPDAPGPLTLELALDHPHARAANRYESRISRREERDGRMTP